MVYGSPLLSVGLEGAGPSVRASYVACLARVATVAGSSELQHIIDRAIQVRDDSAVAEYCVHLYAVLLRQGPNGTRRSHRSRTNQNRKSGGFATVRQRIDADMFHCNAS